jgi:hypothetical protein
MIKAELTNFPVALTSAPAASNISAVSINPPSQHKCSGFLSSWVYNDISTSADPKIHSSELTNPERIETSAPRSTSIRAVSV